MKMKRFISIAFSVALLVALLCSPAHAATPEVFYTPKIRTGVEWSGLSDDEIYYMDLGIDEIYAVDVDIVFTNTGVGMSEYFIWDNARTAEITVKDEDPGNNVNESLFRRRAVFGVVNGIYRPTSYGTRVILDNGVIEDNSELELYILVEIEAIAGDDATLVPERLFGYSFRTTS